MLNAQIEIPRGRCERPVNAAGPDKDRISKTDQIFTVAHQGSASVANVRVFVKTIEELSLAESISDQTR